MSKPRHVVLMGLMGSGKSTLGVPLARRLGRPYVDNDRQLELRTGQTAHELAAALGLDELHRDEAATLLAALARDEPAVISAPASAITERAIREQLDHAFVVWLDPPIDDLVARFHRQTNRPEIGTDLGAVLARQYAERAPLYREVARLVVHPADGTDTERLVGQIAAAVTRSEAGSEDGRR
jgi:shikimate kinase